MNRVKCDRACRFCLRYYISHGVDAKQIIAIFSLCEDRRINESYGSDRQCNVVK